MALRRLTLALLLPTLAGLSACGTPYGSQPADAPFGGTVRQAIEAQRLPASGRTPAGVPFNEIEPALDRQHKARPVESSTSGNAQGGTGLLGP